MRIIYKRKEWWDILSAEVHDFKDAAPSGMGEFYPRGQMNLFRSDHNIIPARLLWRLQNVSTISELWLHG